MIGFVMVVGGECLRGADDGDMQLVILTILHQVFLKIRVRQMGSVPGEQIIHPMQNGQAKMRSVRARPWWKLKQGDDVLFKLGQLWRNIQLWDTLQIFQPPRRRTSITTAGFINGIN